VLQRELGGAPPPPPPAGHPVLTSNINEGASVEKGTVWTVSSEPNVEEMELWANGVKLVTDTSEPYTVALNLLPGNHVLGIAYTYQGQRIVANGGVWANITVTDSSNPPPPATGFDVPTWEVTSKATTGEGNPEAFQSWLYYSYPHVPSPAAWGGGPLLADFWTPMKDASQGSWTWWWLQEIFIPTSWDQSTEGSMNTLGLDAHNKPEGPGWNFEPGCASGVSSIHTRYKLGNLLQQHERQQDDNMGPNEFVIKNITKGVWHSVAYHYILGRTKDTSCNVMNHPNGGKGRTRVYVDGPLALDTGDINILQRDKCTGQLQSTMSLLQGLYNGGMTAPHTARMTVARVGRTLQEALAANVFNFQMVFYNAVGLDGSGNPRFHTWTKIAPRKSDQFIMPQV